MENRDLLRILHDPSVPDATITELLVQLYYPYIYRVANSLLQDDVEAEDIAQETFVKALLNIRNVATNSNLKAWLATIAINKCRDVLRRRQRWSAPPFVWSLWQRTTRQTMEPQHVIEMREAEDALWAAVAQLNEKHRVPLILRYVHNMSIREIAAHIHVKEGTIHSRLFNAIKRLERMLPEGDSAEILRRSSQ